MAKPGFWNDNEGRNYPFLDYTTGRADVTAGTTGLLPKASVVDAGFLFGPSAGFDHDLYKVWLHAVRRVAADEMEFEFRTNAPGASDLPLVFSRELSDDPVYQFVSSGAFEGSVSADDDCDTEPPWEGFLVTGDLTKIFDLLDTVSEALDGSNKLTSVEPGVIQNMAQHFVRGVGVANVDRTRATTPDGCQDLCWPVEPVPTWVNAVCLRGPIAFEEGYNIVIQQDDDNNRLLFDAAVGGGDGEPCEQPQLAEEERKPRGRDTYDGAILCGEVVRSIGGATGPTLEIAAGAGATVIFDKERHKVIVDVNLTELAMAVDFPEHSECDEEPEEESLDPCSCGPEDDG